MPLPLPSPTPPLPVPGPRTSAAPEVGSLPSLGLVAATIGLIRGSGITGSGATISVACERRLGGEAPPSSSGVNRCASVSLISRGGGRNTFGSGTGGGGITLNRRSGDSTTLRTSPLSPKMNRQASITCTSTAPNADPIFSRTS